MGDDKPLINVSVAGDLGPAADTFVKKVSKGFGGVFAPWQIKRVAKAEAAASLIQAKAEIEITDLQRRAMHRFLEEEARHQQNIEDITAKAIPLLEDAPKSEEMDDDWVTNFFAKSRIVSNAEMQQLWARVLSGEANTPGTYSTRTVNFLAELDKTDCEIFSACAIVLTSGE